MSKSVKLAAAAVAVSVALAPVANATHTWVTVNGVERPVCYYEDGSDSAVLPCVWFDPGTGSGYLTYATYSLRLARIEES